MAPLCRAVHTLIFSHCPAWPSIPPSSGSPAELCQLCVDDEIVAVDGVAVAHMNYNQWKDKMTSALQTGSLTMDIRRYGNTGKIMSHRQRTVMSLTASWNNWFNL